LVKNLDYIRGLGFNTLQIMPRHPSPSYAVDDYYDAARQFGDAQGLKDLVREAHRRGMRVILDWLVHGVIDQKVARQTSQLVDSVADEAYKHRGLPDYVLNFAPYWLRLSPADNPVRLQHPEWFMRFEDGSLGHIYTWAFDLENRALQDYIINAMKYYVQTYDIDGFRVDAPTWNGFPNWDKAISYRASRSTTGAIRLFDRALPILRNAKPDIMMYTEPATAVFRRMFDTNYAYEELWIFEQLLAWRSRLSRSAYAAALGTAQKPITAFQARQWLENRRRSMPPGIVTIHQVDSHDSFWWLPPGEKFRREQFGAEGARALLFMIGTLDGGMMHYPTGEQGNEEFMRRVLALRGEVPQISNGRCEYLKVRVSDDSVFAVSWESPEGVAIPLTNLGQTAVNVRVELPGGAFNLDPRAGYRARDVFNGKPVGKFPDVSVQLAPLESALVVIVKP
ncbi:MAG: alpha-amylase family glycosyl hydrolase, partial [Acidobacteria bacterium]|nr:alpha-amylase family glycosyl hydrolase [Acidobacteriota bacterium]